LSASGQGKLGSRFGVRKLRYQSQPACDRKLFEIGAGTGRSLSTLKRYGQVEALKFCILSRATTKKLECMSQTAICRTIFPPALSSIWSAYLTNILTCRKSAKTMRAILAASATTTVLE
jgi:hypothetical protein